MRLTLLLALLLFCCFPAQAQNVGKGLGAFGFDYFGKLEDEKNLVVSPLSVHAAFSMLALGAAGETRDEALRVLNLEDSFESDYGGFLESLTPEAGRLVLASRVWPTAALELERSYLEKCRVAFGAEPRPLDFSEPERARDTINGWVSEQTEALVPELIPSGGIDRTTELVLSNALYFEGEWAHPFAEGRTEKAPFHSPGGAVETPMMRGSVVGLYHPEEEFEVVSLLYRDSPLAMAFVVPRQLDGWKRVKPNLSPEMLERVERASLRSATDERVELWLPKFKVAQSSDPLVTLRAMGMDALLGPAPDLSRLSPRAEGMVVDDCFHEAVVEVDEKGTRAAAATAVTMTRSMPKVAAEVKVDRPFFFVLYHRSTLAPLFIGQVLEPV